MQVLPQCGHAVHEDAPDKVSLVPSGLRGQLGGMWDFTESRINLCPGFTCNCCLQTFVVCQLPKPLPAEHLWSWLCKSGLRSHWHPLFHPKAQ